MVISPIKHVISGVQSDNKGKSTLNRQMIIEEKKACKDEISEKACQKLKKKNKGKGCEKKSTQKKCKKTCALCDDGKFFYQISLNSWGS